MKRFLAIVFWAFVFLQANATVFYSVGNGSFTDPNNWSPNGIPNLGLAGDSVYVNHEMFIPATGQYVIRAYLHIRTGASLYTPNQTTIKTTGHVVVWGYLDIQNNLYMDAGGKLYIYYGGFVFVDNKVDVTGGGDITLVGGTICWHNLWKGGPPNGVGIMLHGQCFSSTGPLGITLISFSVECNEGKTMLCWVTENETNNDHFTIERSHDLEVWEVIGTVPGQLASTGIVTYRLEDQLSCANVHYYRVSQTDVNGASTVYEDQWLRASDCFTGYTGMLASPNPVIGNLTLAVNTKEEVHFYLYDYLGRLALEGNACSEQRLFDLQHLDTGVYFLCCAGQKTIKIVKQ